MTLLTALEDKIKKDNKEEPTYLAIDEEELVIVDNNNLENQNQENLISLYKYIDNELKNPEKQETYFKPLVKIFKDAREGKLKEFISRYIHKYIEHTYNQNNSRKNLEFFYKQFYITNESAKEYIQKYAKQDDLALLIALSQLIS